MEINTLATILLVGRMIAIYFMSSVVRRQLQLMKMPINDEVRTFRKILLGLAIALLISNIVPAILDILTIVSVNSLGRTPVVGDVGIFYTLFNCSGAIVSSLLVWMLYRLAANTKEVTDFEAKQLQAFRKK